MLEPIQPLNRKATPDTRAVQTPDQIIDCALTVFSRLGVARTRLEDVAAEAGISRPLVYKYFANRQALLDAAIIKKLEQHLEIQRHHMPKEVDFKDAIVDGAVIALRHAKQDAVMLDLFEHSSVQHLPELLLNRKMPVHQIFMDLWKPIFDRARHKGELRLDLNDDDMLEWLLSVNFTFGLREDIDEVRLRKLLHQFVVPAFVSSAAP
jgi:AcrR family transcriptional regulator